MGMMGQFLVTDQFQSIEKNQDLSNILIYPNPSNSGLFSIKNN